MKTYMTVFIPELNIMKTVNKDIIKIDLDNPFKVSGKKDNYYRVDPYLYSNNGYIIDAISEKQLKNLNTYESVIIANGEYLSDILESEFNILYHQLDNIGVIVTYTGDCDEYDGEQIAINKMIAYANELKEICEKRI